MDWITEVPSRGNFNENNDDMFSIPKIRKLDLSEIKPCFDTISHFFLSLSTTGEQPNVTYLPIPNEKIYEMALQCLGTHFADVKSVAINGDVKQLILREVVYESEKKLQEARLNNEIHPIIMDLFFSSDLNNITKPHEVQNKTVYKIINSKIETYQSTGFEATWNFLSNCYSREGDLLVTPGNWYLNDELKNSVALRYFSAKVSKLNLWVNSDTLEVLYLHMKFD